MSEQNEVPAGRYRVIYSTTPPGGSSAFSAVDDQAAWEYARRTAYGARIVSLARHWVGNPDRHQELTEPESSDRSENPRVTLRMPAQPWVELPPDDQYAWFVTLASSIISAGDYGTQTVLEDSQGAPAAMIGPPPEATP